MKKSLLAAAFLAAATLMGPLVAPASASILPGIVGAVETSTTAHVQEVQYREQFREEFRDQSRGERMRERNWRERQMSRREWRGRRNCRTEVTRRVNPVTGRVVVRRVQRCR